MKSRMYDRGVSGLGPWTKADAIPGASKTQYLLRCRGMVTNPAEMRQRYLVRTASISI